MDTADSGIVRLASVGSYLDALSSIASELSLKQRSNLIYLDKCLHELWGLGRNFILNWCPEDEGVTLLTIPHYAIADYASSEAPCREPDTALPPSAEFFKALISGRRLLNRRQIDNVARLLRVETIHLPLRESLGDTLAQTEIVEKMIKRYSISYAPDRAAALFDIVGFGLLTPFEQLTQLNSLSYSMNSAQSKLMDQKIGIDFARSTTGDGFYLWNRSVGLDANINLYHFMLLVLADNAIAQSKAQYNTVPRLRASFHIASTYEFHQAEGLNPTLYNYIVGDLTVELARMTERALPNQVLVGEFQARDAANDARSHLDAINFVTLATSRLEQLEGLELAGEKIECIKSYLTGAPLEDGRFTVRRITIKDKHGRSRNVFNAKASIYRRQADPILLGLEDRSLDTLARPDSASRHLLHAS